MSDPFGYCFRFCCDPGFNDRAEVQKLLSFVDAGKIDDVMVFANVEEINIGHFSFEEQRVFLDLLETLGPLLKEKGVTLSVNHWHSLMHADLGKRFHPDLEFDPMVDADGKAAQNCVCPLSQSWRTYIGEIYARYAALHPDTLWVEDDFRLHNHDPLHWGGCFCQAHMREFSKRLGHSVTREAFFSALLRPGEPSPEREVWLSVCRESMEGAARAISQAVRQVDPGIKIGLMSSVPYVHSAEGRDWTRLLTIFAGGNAPVSRIHLPAYQERTPSSYLAAFHMVSMVNRALLPPGTLVYPELENYPYSRFSKSLRFTRFQLLSALAIDVSGMTVDLFDLNGRGIIQHQGWEEMLRGVKPYLNRMNASRVFHQPRQGVCVLVDPTSSATLHTVRGDSMEELYPQEVFWAGLLPAMGIPCYISTDPASVRGVAAISGQYFRSLRREQIEALFREHYLLLNGDALETLLSMGLGDLAGVEDARFMEQNQGEFSYEQVCDGRIYTGVPFARASAIISASDALNVRYHPGAHAQALTMFHDSFRNVRCPGTVVVDNRVLIFPFGRFSSPQDIPPMLRNDVRQELLSGALSRSGRLASPMVAGMPDLVAYVMESSRGFSLYLVNGSMDEALEIHLTNLPDGEYSVAVDPSQGEAFTCAATINGGECRIPCPIESMESAYIEIKQKHRR